MKTDKGYDSPTKSSQVQAVHLIELSPVLKIIVDVYWHMLMNEIKRMRT